MGGGRTFGGAVVLGMYLPDVMTYLEFHLIFNLPLLALLLWLGRKRLTWTHWKWIGAICAIVMAFTYPWDSWAVGRRIWEFDDDRVLMRVGRLPVEEIGFFLIETVVVCLIVIHLLPKRPEEHTS